VDGGFVYVFPGQFGTYWDSQPIDIFSLSGKYLYRTEFIPGKGFKIYNTFPMMDTILIRDGFLYVVRENEDGDVVVSKYKVSLPDVLKEEK
jgi:hypothetical protein